MSETIELRRKAAIVDDLEKLMATNMPEAAFQELFEREWWLLGGSFVGIYPDQRTVNEHQQHDIHLEAADGIVHIFELKRADVKSLIVKNSGGLPCVSGEVNAAVGQGQAYLEVIDQDRNRYTAPVFPGDTPMDFARASVTVIIGRDTAGGPYDAEAVRRTLRRYNSHLSRIQVITYDDVLGYGKRILGMLEHQAAP